MIETGYETTLIFVKGRETGYQEVIASVDLCKVCYNAMGELIKRKQAKEDKATIAAITAYNKHYRTVWVDGEWHPGLPKSQRQKSADALSKEEYTLEKKLPYCFWDDQNMHSFNDDYGTPLMFAELDEVYEALRQDHDDDRDHYWRFDIALMMLAAFRLEETKLDPKGEQHVRVILWGH